MKAKRAGSSLPQRAGGWKGPGWSARNPLLVLLLLGMLVSACNYQTIGGGGTMPIPATVIAKGSKGLLAAPTQAKPPAQSAPRPTVPGPDAVFCRLSDLTPNATWNETDQGLVGSVTLANYWPTTCALLGLPQLGLTDENGQDYPLKVVAPTPAAVPQTFTFKENTVAEIRFVWSNWCGPAPSGSMRVTVTMPKQIEPTLYVVVQDGNGNPLNNAPLCDDKSKPSTLTVQKMRLLN